MTATARRIAPTRPEDHLARLREIAAEHSGRRFVAKIVGHDTGERSTVNAADFVDAAIAFLETSAIAADTEALKIAVTDCETGLTECFSLDFETGDIKQT